MPFPTGLRAMAEQGREISVPWVWGVNGAMSVLASVGGMILAIEFGYTVVFAAGALCYLGAALLFRAWAGRPGSPGWGPSGESEVGIPVSGSTETR